MTQAAPLGKPIPKKPLAAGSEIDAWCTRCKLDLGHRIVAMVTSTPKRVICLTCGSEHNYRAPKPAPGGGRNKTAPAASGGSKGSSKSKGAGRSAGAAGNKSAGTRGAARAREEWENQVRSGRAFRDYSIDKRFDVGDLVRHKKFGDGYVVALAGPQKLTIAFFDGERTLIHDQD